MLNGDFDNIIGTIDTIQASLSSVTTSELYIFDHCFPHDGSNNIKQYCVPNETFDDLYLEIRSKSLGAKRIYCGIYPSIIAFHRWQ